MQRAEGAVHHGDYHSRFGHRQAGLPLKKRQRRLGGFGTDSSQTPRWREPDSNLRYRVRERFSRLPHLGALGAAKALLPFAEFVRPRWHTRGHYRGRCNLSATMRLTGTRDTIRSRNQRYRPREPPWFSHSSSAAPGTTPPSRAGARFEQVVACCSPRRPLLAVRRVCRCPNLSFAG